MQDMKKLEASYKETIIKLIEIKHSGFAILLLKNAKYQKIRNYLFKKYPQLVGHKISEYCYWFIYDLTDFPKCKNCGKAITDNTYFKFSRGYLKFCSCKCSATFTETKAKRSATCQKKYHATWVTQCKYFKKKSEKTCLKKFGGKNPFQNEEIKKKCRQTCLKNFGVEISSQNHDIRVKQQRRYMYNGIHFDSSWEIAYYIWLTDNKIKFEYQPDMKFEYEYKNKNYVYIPDFKINNKLIELKGDQFFKEDGTMQNPFDSSQNELYEFKHQFMLSNHVKILRFNDIKPILAYVESKYGKNYLAQFKNRK
jgi:hypothetical protein